METVESGSTRALRRAFPGCLILDAWRLSGGVSANATRYDLALADGTSKRVVVREPPRPEEGDGSGTTIEYQVLVVARASGVPCPEPCFVDGDERIVLEYLEGAPDLAQPLSSRKLDEMVSHLWRIHSVAATGHELAFLPSVWDRARNMVHSQPAELDESLGEGRIRRALTALWPPAPSGADVLLHGDYWPGNLLWQGERMTGVIDWEEAARGDPLFDVAITRLDVLWAFGVEAMTELTRRYAALTRVPLETLPRWDLLVSLRPMSNLRRWASSYAGPPVNRPDIDEASMRRGHQWFVEQAFERLGVSARD